MKKTYLEPEIDLVYLEAADIVTLTDSGGDGGGGDDNIDW